MALKHSTPMEEQDPPSADSTTEEEEEEEEENEHSSSSEDNASSEDEVKKTPKPSSPQQPPKNPETTTSTTTSTTSTTTATITPKSESESEESDSDTEPEKTPVPNVTNIRLKRALEEKKDIDKKDAKKAKKSSGTDEEHDDDSKQLTADPKKRGLVQKHLFQRLFSEADEIAMLKGMIDYSLANKGVDPMTDFNGYFDFVKGSLHFDVKKSQLMDKSKRLKSKYWKQGGGVLKGHDLKVYELSKKVWGCGGGNGGEESPAAVSKIDGKVLRTPRPNASATPKIADLVAEGKKMKMKIDGIKEETRSGSNGVLFDTNVGLGGMNEYVVKNGLELVNLSERVELEERWRTLQLAQLELFVEQSKLIFDQAKLMLEAAKNV